MLFTILIIVAVLSFIIGFIAFPFCLFLRARRDPQWDDSNMTNIFRLLAHIATHPNDFTKMRYIGTGKNPFWYLSKDEFSEVVKTRPDN